MNANANVNLTETSMLGMEETFVLHAPLELGKRIKDASGETSTVVLGTVEVFYPTLEDFGIVAQHDVGAEAKRKPSEVYPIYSDERLQWLYSAVVAKVEAFARSKTADGKLKSGMSIPTTFAELTEVGQRGGEYLKIKSEAIKSFAGFLEGLGKKKGLVELYSSLFAQPEGLKGVEKKYFTAFVSYLGDWAKAQSEELQARYVKVVEKVTDAIQAKAEMGEEV
jgi:hypothetical protein